MSTETRTSRYKAAMLAAPAPMTVREICDKAGIPAGEAKFVSSGLDREVKVGRAEKTGPVTCPVTNRKSVAYKLIEVADPVKAAAKTVATNQATAPKGTDPSDAIPDPKKTKNKTVAAKRRAS